MVTDMRSKIILKGSMKEDYYTKRLLLVSLNFVHILKIFYSKLLFLFLDNPTMKHQNENIEDIAIIEECYTDEE